MSGGSYDYAFHKVEEFAGRMSRRPMTPQRKALYDHLQKVADAMRAVEWNDSGDGANEDEAIMAVVSSAELLSSAKDDLRQAIAEANGVLKYLESGEW